MLSPHDSIHSSPVRFSSRGFQYGRKTPTRSSPDMPGTEDSSWQGNLSSSPVKNIFSSPVRFSPSRRIPDRSAAKGIDRVVEIPSSDDSSEYEEIHSSPVKQPRRSQPICTLGGQDECAQSAQAPKDEKTEQTKQNQVSERSETVAKKGPKKTDRHKSSKKVNKNSRQGRSTQSKSVTQPTEHKTSRASKSHGGDRKKQNVQSSNLKGNKRTVKTGTKVPHQELEEASSQQENCSEEDLESAGWTIFDQAVVVCNSKKPPRRKLPQQKPVCKSEQDQCVALINGSGKTTIARNDRGPKLRKKKSLKRAVSESNCKEQNLAADLKDRSDNCPSSGEKANPKYCTKRKSASGSDHLVNERHVRSKISEDVKDGTEHHTEDLKLDNTVESVSPEYVMDTRINQTGRKPLKALSAVKCRQRVKSGNVINHCQEKLINNSENINPLEGSSLGIAEEVKTVNQGKRNKTTSLVSKSAEKGIEGLSDSSIKSSLTVTMYQRWNVLPLTEALRTEADMPKLHVPALFGRGGVLDFTKKRVWKSVVDENE